MPVSEWLLDGIDVEGLIADLAFRYTTRPSEEELQALPKPLSATHKALMASMLACFEALVAANRVAVLCNTIVWVLLGAAEDGALDALRGGGGGGGDEGGGSGGQGGQGGGQLQQHASFELHRPQRLLDERTVLCVRFLASLAVDGTAAGVSARSLLEAAQLNLQAEHGLNVPTALLAGWIGVDAGAGE